MSKVRKKSRESFDRDAYWMGMAFFIAAGSKNYGRQQGAVVVSSSSELMSMACDGSPKSMPDCEHHVHAELNALFGAKGQVQGGAIYITHTPCYHCCLAILSAAIKKVIYFPTRSLEENSSDALRSCYVQVDEFCGNLNWMRDYMKTLESLNIFN